MSPVKELSAKEVETRLAGKTGAAYAAELRLIAEETEGVKVEAPANEPAVQLTEDQFDRMFSGVLNETKKVVSEAAEQFERKYDLSNGEAREHATQYISEEVRKQSLKMEEDKIIGKRFASVMKRQLGFIEATDDYSRSIEDENDFMRKHYGRERRDMSLGTDTTGGFLAPELWETRLYQALAKTNYARRLCTQINMGNREIMRLPKMTAGMTAYMVGETNAATLTQPTFSQFTLQPRKCVAMTNPVSIELLEAGDPNVIDLLTSEAMRAFGRKEDEAVFVGSDSVFSGLMESTTNVVSQGGATNSGKTAISQITFDDLFNMWVQLDEQYTPDSGTENSGGGIGGSAAYYFNKQAINALHKLKGADNYYMDVRTMMDSNKVNGFDLNRVIDLPSAPAVATNFGVFGNLSYVYFGYRPGIRMDVLKEGTVNGSNLGTTAQYALRFIEFFDQARIDDSAFSILRTSAS